MKSPGIHRSGSFPIAIPPDSDQWLMNEEILDGPQLKKMYKRLRALCLLSRDVYACQQYDEILGITLAFLDKLINPERIILAIQAAGGPILSIKCKGIDVSNDISSWDVSQNLLRKVHNEHLAILSTDAYEDERLKDFKSVHSLNIRSVLCVPLGTQEYPKGLAYLDSRLQSGVFDRHDLYFLTAICRLLDAAIVSLEQKIEQKNRGERAQQHITMLQSELFAQHQIVGQSKPLLEAYDKLKRIAGKTDIPILLRGESGTGKELFARAIHYSSKRKDEPFIPVNLAAMSESLIESELFGHEKGAFTGADKLYIGLLERANGGALFLDEIADVPVSIQAKLLRVLQEKEFQRIGGNKTIRSDFRLIAATCQDIESMLREGKFREDLFRRIAGVSIQLPPLRERCDDIPLLIEHFLSNAGLKSRFSDPAIRFLQSQPWPGNIRQLQYIVLAAAAMATQDIIAVRDIQDVMGIRYEVTQQSENGLQNVADYLAEKEKEHMLKALELTNGRATKAAELIGMAKSTFSERRKRYGI